MNTVYHQVVPRTGHRFSVQLKQAAVIVNCGTALFAGINIYRGNEKFYREIAMPVVNLLPPEVAHKLSIKLVKYKIVPRLHTIDHPSLRSVVWGRSFPNPVGLAAGYDKHAEAIDGFFKMGFGFVEVGSVTPKPQESNPKPCEIHLVEDGALITRYGFNSDGHNLVYHRLRKRFMQVDESGYQHTYLGEQRNMLNINFWSDTETDTCQPNEWNYGHVLNSRRHFRKKDNGIVGVNLGKNQMSVSPTDDYIKGVRKFGHVADYLVVNISGSGSSSHRDMLRRDELMMLLHKVLEERDGLTVSPKPAVLVKVCPDLSDENKRDIADVVLRPQSRVDGLIVCNTTVSRPSSLRSKYRKQQGGLSGQPLRQKSLETIRDMYKLTQGEIPIVGVGGVSCGQDAYKKVRAGASLVQVYTALVYHGPPVIDKIKREMRELLRQDGYSHISEAVGADVKGHDKKREHTCMCGQ